MQKIKLTYVFFIISFLIVSCKKNSQQDNTPYVPVDIYINLTLPQYQSLNAPGGWAYAQGGLKGIIVYRRGMDEFIAYDRNCTFNETNSCGSATVDSSNVLINCDCDGSVYNIFDGSVNQGPATLPLKVYNATYDGSNTVRVYN